MRIDKFLKVSRILKRRTVANTACDSGRVEVGGKQVKPSYRLKEGDEVTLRFGEGAIKFVVLNLNEKANKAQAQDMYRIIEE